MFFNSKGKFLYFVKNFHIFVLLFWLLPSSCTKSKSPEASPKKSANEPEKTSDATEISDDPCASSKLRLTDDEDESDEDENEEDSSKDKEDEKRTTTSSECEKDSSEDTTSNKKLDYSSLKNPSELAECNGLGKIFNFGYNVEGNASKAIKCFEDSVWDKSICKSQEALIKAFGNSGKALETKLAGDLKDFELTLQCGKKSGQVFATFIKELVKEEMPALEFKTVNTK